MGISIRVGLGRGRNRNLPLPSVVSLWFFLFGRAKRKNICLSSYSPKGSARPKTVPRGSTESIFPRPCGPPPFRQGGLAARAGDHKGEAKRRAPVRHNLKGEAKRKAPLSPLRGTSPGGGSKGQPGRRPLRHDRNALHVRMPGHGLGVGPCGRRKPGQYESTYRPGLYSEHWALSPAHSSTHFRTPNSEFRTAFFSRRRSTRMGTRIVSRAMAAAR